ncbi:hypothetical protein LAPL110952_06420 [Lactiplantibacillus plajomi]
MKLIKAFFLSYLRVAIFYVLTMYLVTAPPTGPFVFRWTLANSGLTLSYLIFYPVLIYRVPNLKKRRFAFQSLNTRSLKRLIEEDHLQFKLSIRNERLLFKSQMTDTIMSSELTFFVQGALLLVSGPVLIGLGLSVVTKKWLKKRVK